MGLTSSLVAQVVTKTTAGYKRGTAYPICPNVILTARHVVPDLGNIQKTCVRWLRDDTGEVIEEHFLEEVLYPRESDRYDLLVARCKTPRGAAVVDLSDAFPSSKDDHWDSCGYPSSGQDHEKKYRVKEPAKGTFFISKDDDFIQQLEVKGDATRVELWKGISGAPVFLADENKLIAVIIETPRQDKTGNPVHENRLYATSIPYVLKHCEKFRSVVRCGELTMANAHYLEQQRRKLHELLLSNQVIHEVFSRAYFSVHTGIDSGQLSSLVADSLIDQKQRERAVSLGKVRGCLLNVFKLKQEASIAIATKVEEIFNCCLALAFPECKVENSDLKSKKAHKVMVMELQTLEIAAARLYNIRPNLFSDKKIGVKGRYAHDSQSYSIRDTSWRVEDKARHFVDRFIAEVLKAKTKRKADTRLLSERRDANRLYYVYVELEANKEPALTDEVIELIRADKNLPNLPIFYFGEKEDDLISDVSGIIDPFYDDLNEYIQKAPEVNTE